MNESAKFCFRSFAVLLVSGLVLTGCSILGRAVEGQINTKILSSRDTADLVSTCGSDCALAKGLFVADLHADSLLWGRDPRLFSTVGHVDLPRLRKAGVDLQVFSAPSWTPKLKGGAGGLASCVDADSSSYTTLLYRATGRSARTGREIAYEQAQRFCEMTSGDWSNEACTYAEPDPEKRAQNTDSYFAVRSAADLQALRAAIEATPAGAPQPVGAMLSIEGVHWIPEAADRTTVRKEIRALRDAGFRMIALTHRFNNGLGGSDEDCRGPQGLTSAGAFAVEEVLDAGLVLDVAHLSHKALFEDEDGPNVRSIVQASRHAQAPAIVMSHGGVNTKNCDLNRNFKARAVTAILMDLKAPFGVIHWDKALCAEGKGDPRARYQRVETGILDAYRAAMEYVVADEGSVVEATKRLALGADYDGAINAPFDVTGFPYLISRLGKQKWCKDLDQQEAGACDEAVANIAGENVYNFLLSALAVPELEDDQ